MFPSGEPGTSFPDPVAEIIPAFDEAELRLAAKRLANGEFSGLNGIPNEILKLTIEARPEMILALFNKCLQAGAFPAPWKRQKLVLIPKGKGGDPMTASSHRPPGMLGNLGKRYERMVLNRLEAAYEDTGGMAPMQFSFRMGLSTLHAVETVQNAIEEAANMQRYPGGFSAVILLDVKNASNSASWERMYEALSGRVPGYF